MVVNKPEKPNYCFELVSLRIGSKRATSPRKRSPASQTRFRLGEGVLDGIDKLTRKGRKWSSVGHCYPDAVAATQVAIALSLRWRSVQRLIRWRWTLNVL